MKSIYLTGTLFFAFIMCIGYKVMAQNSNNLTPNTTSGDTASNSEMGVPVVKQTVEDLNVKVWLKPQDEHNQMNSQENSGKNGSGSNNLENQSSRNRKDLSMMVKVTDAKGNSIGNDVVIKIVSPSRKTSKANLKKTNDHFEGELSLREKGTYKLTAMVNIDNAENKRSLQLAPVTYVTQ
jgi:hypothetical protein